MRSLTSSWFAGLGCLSPIVGFVALFYLIRQDDILQAFLLFALFFLLAVLLLYLADRSEEQVKRKQRAFLETFQPTISNYQASYVVIADDLLSKMAIDEKKGRIFLWQPLPHDGKVIKRAYYRMPYEIISYPMTDLLAVELYENGLRQSVFLNEDEQTTQRLQALNLKVDVTPSETSSSKWRKRIYKKIATIELKLIFNDAKQPVHIIRFYTNLDRRLSKKSKQYIMIRKNVDHWLSILQFHLQQH